MKTNRNSRRKKLRTRLFPFTEHEERMMAMHIALSKVFMELYGKGRDPYMINRKNYLCNE